MKLIDNRIQKEEVTDLSEELISVLTEALNEDYAVLIDLNHENYLKAEFRKVLAKFFNVKI
jgi:hypothetical protein